MKCWELRGCYDDEEMNSRCPHNIPGEPCPADCHFAACFRPTHVVCSDFAKLLNPERDFDAGQKKFAASASFSLSGALPRRSAPQERLRARATRTGFCSSASYVRKRWLS